MKQSSEAWTWRRTRHIPSPTQACQRRSALRVRFRNVVNQRRYIKSRAKAPTSCRGEESRALENL